MAQAPTTAPKPRLLAALFIASGFSALAYQVILSRYLQLVMGSTAYAVSAILVAFMLGMAIGSAIGGGLADAARLPLRVYALAEGAIGLYCAAFPLLYPVLLDCYLAVAPPLGVGSAASRNAVRFGLGAAAFLFPSILMGLTTPAVARAAAAGPQGLGLSLARLYGWNTVGAAAGAFVTAYALVPVFGLVGSLGIGCAINAIVAALAYWIAPDFETTARPPEGDAAPTGDATVPHRRLLLFAAFGSGFLSFALEVLWTHLLAVLIGNSVYAFGLMLGSLLLGLALGTLFARRLAEPPARARNWVGWSLGLAGVSVVVTLPLWDRIPFVFLLLARSAPSFPLMEGVRFLVALGLMLLPTACFGISFPLILRSFAAGEHRLGAHVGAVYAVNTAGAVAGALAGAYVLLPALGSLMALKAMGSALMALGAAVSVRLGSYRWRTVAAIAGVVAALAALALPVWWNFETLNMASAIYLGTSGAPEGHLVFRSEDPTGGLTTVVENRGVRTLLTNGKFQGDNSEEVPIEHRLANLATLFTAERERALVIGLGTGVTLASVAAHGFQEVVCAEISDPIVEAAKRFFGDVNRSVLSSPAVRLLREDGRSVLLESPARYDVISVEITTIWFAGVGPLYSQEFYRLASSRLRRDGVLLQWFPIHHLSARNLYVVVNTMRSVFPYVSVWNHLHQGFVVASNDPLRIDLESVRRDLGEAGVRPILDELQSGSPLELLSDLVVTDDDMDHFLDSLARLLHADRSLVSTDAWPTIEYETPKDILDNFAYFQNRATLVRFRSPRPFPFRGDPTTEEARLADSAFSHGWRDPRALARLSAAWSAEGSRSTGRWLLDELSPDEAAASGYEADPSVDLGRHGAQLTRFLSTLAEPRCEPSPAFADKEAVPLTVERASGTNASRSGPQAALDTFVAPEWSQGGWLVRGAGRPPTLDLRLDHPRRVGSVHVAVDGVDGNVVRTRVFGLDERGRWWPLASGSQLSDLRCRGTRVYPLGADVPALVVLRLETQGEALSNRIAVHEVWALERKGHE